jgi:nicotinate-nucleotide pyrophosphorylase (carboxylating)
VLDIDALRPTLQAALAEDIGSGDVTSALTVGEGARGRGMIVAKAEGILAGVTVAIETLKIASHGDIEIHTHEQDGEDVQPGDTVLTFTGPARGLLAGERTALNFLCHLSGIATLTNKFVNAVAGTHAKILDTRKTTPGLRVLEKHAVKMGGGENHRFALYDAVLVKENHLAFGTDLADALANRPTNMPAIVEAESMEEFRKASAAGADVVMLDEFTPEQVAAAKKERGENPRPLLEVSGGITLQNIRPYAEAGADRISIGGLTHSAPALDLSMRVEPVEIEGRAD